MQTCPKCNNPIKAGGYCSNCGTPAAVPTQNLSPVQKMNTTENVGLVSTQRNQTKFCLACGNSIESDAKVCGTCGFTL